MVFIVFDSEDLVVGVYDDIDLAKRDCVLLRIHYSRNCYNYYFNTEHNGHDSIVFQYGYTDPKTHQFRCGFYGMQIEMNTYSAYVN